MEPTTTTTMAASRVQTTKARRHLAPVPQPVLNPTVSLVVPTLNEAKNLPALFGGLPHLHELIIVDGRSTDDTIAEAERLRPDVRIVREERAGKGYALSAGFEAATGDIVVMIDADGSMDPGEIESFVEALTNGADFVKGSRYMRGGGSTDLTLIRSTGNRTLTMMVNVLFGTGYTDLCYGYNAFWRRHLGALEVDCAGFEVETLMNIRAAKAGLRIAEVPSFETDRIHGESNLNAWRDGWRIARVIVSETFRRRRKRQAPAAA